MQPNQPIFSYLQSILRGVGQVMFQNNSISGLLFLTGIFYNSWSLGVAAIAGTVVSTATAQLLNYPKQDIADGIYGFNGTLVGIALIYFLGFNLGTSAALIIGAMLSAPIHFYLKKVIPPFTASFIISTWLAIYFLVYFTPLHLSDSIPTEGPMHLLSAGAKGFGQVMFQENIITGILFFIGIFINSKPAAGYALFATFLCIFIAWVVNEPISAINAGLLGYNGILCAIALMDNHRNSAIWIIMAVILSVFITIGFSKIALLTLTAPFVLSTWALLKVKSLKAA